MKYREKLEKRIQAAQTNLCVGLDPRPEYIEGDVRDFLLRVIEETAPWTAAYKPNSAYFEALGVEGMLILESVIEAIPDDIPTILDCKRGDIGETQKYYARSAYDVFGADAVTLSPFLGQDTLEPFLAYPDKGIYLLAVTSNSGSKDIQMRQTRGRYVFELVQDMASHSDQIGLVVGLTNAADDVLARIDDVPLLIPGLGAQGGSLENLGEQKRQAPLLVNVSRGILFSEPGLSFATKAERYAGEIAHAL